MKNRELIELAYQILRLLESKECYTSEIEDYCTRDCPERVEIALMMLARGGFIYYSGFSSKRTMLGES